MKEATEEIIEALCSQMFIDDLVVRNPKFRKSSGSEKEAADFYIVFKDVILAFQVKSKSDPIKHDEKDEVDFKRIRKRIDDAILQLKTSKNAIINSEIKYIKNLRGIEIPIPRKNTKIIGIVVLHLIGEAQRSESLEVHNCEYHHDIPIHIFKLETFFRLVMFLDTISDFNLYLESRERAFLNRKIIGPFRELDFLWLFLTNWPKLNEILSNKNGLCMIEEGSWEKFLEEDHEKIQKRFQNEQHSYFVDAVIRHLHKSIGFDPGFLNTKEKIITKAGSKDAYFVFLNMFVTLRRVQRRELGKLMSEKLARAETQRISYFNIDLDEDAAFVFLASNDEKMERYAILENLCFSIYQERKKNEVYGMASPSRSRLDGGFDFIYASDFSCSEEDQIRLKQIYNSFFKKPESIIIDSWDNTD